VAYELWDPTRRLEESVNTLFIYSPEKLTFHQEKTIHLFRAFAPMLSKRPLKTLAEAVRKVGERNFIIEEKLDGERIQLHKRGAEYLYFSRPVRLCVSLQITDIRIQEGKGLHVSIRKARRRGFLDAVYRWCF
jgi:hypothetical protein